MSKESIEAININVVDTFTNLKASIKSDCD